MLYHNPNQSPNQPHQKHHTSQNSVKKKKFEPSLHKNGIIPDKIIAMMKNYNEDTNFT